MHCFSCSNNTPPETITTWTYSVSISSASQSELEPLFHVSLIHLHVLMYQIESSWLLAWESVPKPVTHFLSSCSHPNWSICNQKTIKNFSLPAALSLKAFFMLWWCYNLGWYINRPCSYLTNQKSCTLLSPKNTTILACLVPLLINRTRHLTPLARKTFDTRF